MNIKTLTRAIAVVIGLAIMLSACGSTTTSRHATSPTTVSSTVVASSPRATAVLPPSLLPEPTGTLAVGVRTVPSVSPAATTRVWYPARSGTGTGAPIYLADKTAAAYGLPAKQLKGAVPRASVERRTGANHDGTRRGRAHAGLGTADGLVDHARTRPREQWLRRRDGRPDARHRRPEHAPARHGPSRSKARPDLLRHSTSRPDRGSRRSPDPSTRTRSQSEVTPSPVQSRSRWASPIDACTRCSTSTDGSTDPRWTTPVAVPALMIDASGLEPATRAVIGRTATAVTVKLAGATHLDVTDLPCLVRGLGAAARLIRLGSIGCAGTTTTNAVVLRFLDTVLRDGKPTPSAASLTRGLTAIR